MKVQGSSDQNDHNMLKVLDELGSSPSALVPCAAIQNSPWKGLLSDKERNLLCISRIIHPTAYATEVQEGAQKRTTANLNFVPPIKAASKIFIWNRGSPLIGLEALNLNMIPYRGIMQGDLVIRDRFEQLTNVAHMEIASSS